MQIRKLDKYEHGKTRKLYETVFFEDTKEFVDYYYTWKTRDNIIYVAEDEEGIHAMIHLNPFDVWVEGQVQKLHYIVAVSTEEKYRHQGLMSRLLEAVEKEMAEHGEAFTFLMPASEKIYEPFGYRYFAEQRRGTISGAGSRGGWNHSVEKGNWQMEGQKSGTFARAAEIAGTGQYMCRPVKSSEYQKLADFVNEVLKQQYDVFVWRDTAYYERLCAEQYCQNGDVMVIVRMEEDGTEEFTGTFSTVQEGEDSEEKREAPLSIRELILSPEHSKDAMQAVFGFFIHEESAKVDEVPFGYSEYPFYACKVEGSNCAGVLAGEISKPLLMGKVPAEEFRISSKGYDNTGAKKETAGGSSGCLKRKRIFINEVV